MRTIHGVDIPDDPVINLNGDGETVSRSSLNINSEDPLPEGYVVNRAAQDILEAHSRESTPLLNKHDKKRIPEYFSGPVSYQIFQNPVIASEGYTYEEDSLKEIFARGGKSVFTRETLQKRYVKNTLMKDAVENYLNEHPSKRKQQYNPHAEKDIREKKQQAIIGFGRRYLYMQTCWRVVVGLPAAYVFFFLTRIMTLGNADTGQALIDYCDNHTYHLTQAQSQQFFDQGVVDTFPGLFVESLLFYTWFVIASQLTALVLYGGELALPRNSRSFWRVFVSGFLLSLNVLWNMAYSPADEFVVAAIALCGYSDKTSLCSSSQDLDDLFQGCLLDELNSPYFQYPFANALLTAIVIVAFWQIVAMLAEIGHHLIDRSMQRKVVRVLKEIDGALLDGDESSTSESSEPGTPESNVVLESGAAGSSASLFYSARSVENGSDSDDGPHAAGDLAQFAKAGY